MKILPCFKKCTSEIFKTILNQKNTIKSRQKGHLEENNDHAKEAANENEVEKAALVWKSITLLDEYNGLVQLTHVSYFFKNDAKEAVNEEEVEKAASGIHNFLNPYRIVQLRNEDVKLQKKKKRWFCLKKINKRGWWREATDKKEEE